MREGNTTDEAVVGDDDDDASAEGAAVRNLFQMSKSSSSSSSLLSTTSTYDDDDKETATTTSKSSVTIQIMMDNVKIAQAGSNSKISEIVWPLASFLASFVLDYYHEHVNNNKNISSSSNNNNNNKSDTAEKKENDNITRCNRNKLNTNDNSLLRNTNQSKVVQECFNDLQRHLASTTSHPIRIIELGSGVGLTGLKIAMEIPCQILLTDLEEAMPLLNKNIQLNSHNFKLGPCAVSCTPLPWSDVTTNKTTFAFSTTTPLLILASDCVYHEELHLSFEKTLVSILSNNSSSIGLLAGERRWKRDTTFYSKLGRRTRTHTHTLECTCIHEVVERRTSSSCAHRNIFRVYAVRWVRRSSADKTHTHHEEEEEPL